MVASDRRQSERFEYKLTALFREHVTATFDTHTMVVDTEQLGSSQGCMPGRNSFKAQGVLVHVKN